MLYIYIFSSYFYFNRHQNGLNCKVSQFISKSEFMCIKTIPDKSESFELEIFLQKIKNNHREEIKKWSHLYSSACKSWNNHTDCLHCSINHIQRHKYSFDLNLKTNWMFFFSSFATNSKFKGEKKKFGSYLFTWNFYGLYVGMKI